MRDDKINMMGGENMSDDETYMGKPLGEFNPLALYPADHPYFWRRKKANKICPDNEECTNFDGCSVDDKTDTCLHHTPCC